MDSHIEFNQINEKNVLIVFSEWKCLEQFSKFTKRTSFWHFPVYDVKSSSYQQIEKFDR